jgi:hypothetical protein
MCALHYYKRFKTYNFHSVHVYFKAHNFIEKAQLEMSLLKGDVLLEWINEETKLHIILLPVIRDLFKETFRTRYFSKEYKRQKISAFHIVK